MLIVIGIAAAAALAVTVFSRIRRHSPEASTAVLEAVRELAAIILVCTKAVEAIADVLAGPARLSTSARGAPGWGYEHDYDDVPDDEDPEWEPDYDETEADQR